jgi:hypothetical protein
MRLYFSFAPLTKMKSAPNSRLTIPSRKQKRPIKPAHFVQNALSLLQDANRIFTLSKQQQQQPKAAP